MSRDTAGYGRACDGGGVSEAEYRAAWSAYFAAINDGASRRSAWDAALGAAFAARREVAAPDPASVSDERARDAARLYDPGSAYWTRTVMDRMRVVLATDEAARPAVGAPDQAGEVEQLTRERDEARGWANDWHRVVEMTLLMAGLSPALGGAEAAHAMQAWMAYQARKLTAAEADAAALREAAEAYVDLRERGSSAAHAAYDRLRAALSPAEPRSSPARKGADDD